MKNGLYRHFKGDTVEVIAVSALESDPDTKIVTYRHGRNTWSRYQRIFEGRVTSTNDVDVPRFEYLREYGTQRALFGQTLRENRIFWFEGLKQNPALAHNGEGTYFKFCLGDKISFALALRVITKSEAQKLIDWVNKWSTKEDHLFDRRGAEWEEHCGRKKRERVPIRGRFAPNQEGKWVDDRTDRSHDGDTNQTW